MTTQKKKIQYVTKDDLQYTLGGQVLQDMAASINASDAPCVISLYTPFIVHKSINKYLTPEQHGWVNGRYITVTAEGYTASGCNVPKTGVNTYTKHSGDLKDLTVIIHMRNCKNLSAFIFKDIRTMFDGGTSIYLVSVSDIVATYIDTLNAEISNDQVAA